MARNKTGGGGHADDKVYSTGGGGSGNRHSGGGKNRGGGGGGGSIPDFGDWGGSGLGAFLSNANEEDAAKVVMSGYQQGLKSAVNQLESGYGGLQNQYGKAMDTLAAGGETARGDITAGRDAGVSALYSGQNAGINALYTGQDAGVSALTQGRDAALAGFQPYAEAGEAGSAMYTNALGLGGAEGTQAAQDAFQVGPGYEFAMEQGLTGIDRRAASRGMLGSGNTAQDSIAYSQGLANQEYGDWLDRLAGQQAMGVDVAGQTGTINTTTGQNLSNLYANTGTNAANLYSTTGQAASGVYTGAGESLAGIAQDTAARTSDVQTALGNARYDYGSDVAGLKYATRLGQAGAMGNYLSGKDNLGKNVTGLVTGSASTAANVLNPYGQTGQSSNNIW